MPYYTIRKGDSLASIAGQYGVPNREANVKGFWGRLLADPHNSGIKTPKDLFVGKMIYVSATLIQEYAPRSAPRAAAERQAPLSMRVTRLGGASEFRTASITASTGVRG